MLEVSLEENSKIIHLRYEGRVTHKDYEDIIIPFLENIIAKEEGPFRIFFDLREMDAIEAKAIWDDYKFGIHHIKDFERAVTVGDQWWLNPLMDMASFVYKIKIKNFKSQQYEDALKWINQRD